MSAKSFLSTRWRRGACVPSCATVACGYGEHCTDGTCVQNECHRIVCPDSIECVSGECDTNCAGIICPRGQTCLSGQCRHDPCFNVDCPNGQRCALIDATAQCIADWQNEADMNSGDAIVPNTSDDLGIDRPDTSFTPSTYDQSITPPSFKIDGGVNNSADSNTGGCDCSQNPRNHAPRSPYSSVVRSLYLRVDGGVNMKQRALIFLVLIWDVMVVKLTRGSAHAWR